MHWYCGNRRFDPDPAQCAIDGGGENGGDEWDPDAWTDWNAGGDAAPRRPNRRPRPAAAARAAGAAGAGAAYAQDWEARVEREKSVFQ